jgi:hypothetical protein
LQQKPTLQNLTIIWAALFTSSGIFAFLLTQNPEISQDVADFGGRMASAFAERPEIAVFFMVAVSNIILGWWLPSQLLKRHAQKWTPESAFSDRLAAYVPAAIVRFALFEACSIFGFLAATKTQWLGVAVPFFALNAISMILAFPSADRVLRETGAR